MEPILRTLAMYAVIWVFFRISGKRTLNQITTFDFILLLIVSEATQQAIIGQDYSFTGSVLAVGTFLALDIGLSLLKRRFERVEKVLDSVPVLLIEGGRLHRDRMKKERVDEADILVAAREVHGISRLDDIAYAILETDGKITVVPWASGRRAAAAPARS
jgi:uncharacterized membrane protein YcaP (DUF421 family)